MCAIPPSWRRYSWDTDAPDQPKLASDVHVGLWLLGSDKAWSSTFVISSNPDHRSVSLPPNEDYAATYYWWQLHKRRALWRPQRASSGFSFDAGISDTAGDLIEGWWAHCRARHEQGWRSSNERIRYFYVVFVLLYGLFRFGLDTGRSTRLDRVPGGAASESLTSSSRASRDPLPREEPRTAHRSGPY